MENTLLDIFSGIGGFSLGFEEEGIETIAFCEQDPYAKRVLQKHWPEIPIANDVTKLSYKDGVLYDDGREIYRGTIKYLAGGFPCQDISSAGEQKGIGEGTRSGLWSECARLLRELRPGLEYAVFENVSALLSGGKGEWFEQVLWDIWQAGYDAEWYSLGCDRLGAYHRRERVFIIAYPNDSRHDSQEHGDKREGKTDQQGREERPQSEPGGHCLPVSDTVSSRGQAGLSEKTSREEKSAKILDYICDELRRKEEWRRVGGWEFEPCVGRLAHGVQNRTQRLRCLGNAVVPQMAQLFARCLNNYDKDNR